MSDPRKVNDLQLYFIFKWQIIWKIPERKGARICSPFSDTLSTITHMIFWRTSHTLPLGAYQEESMHFLRAPYSAS